MSEGEGDQQQLSMAQREENLRQREVALKAAEDRLKQQREESQQPERGTSNNNAGRAVRQRQPADRVEQGDDDVSVDESEDEDDEDEGLATDDPLPVGMVEFKWKTRRLIVPLETVGPAGYVLHFQTFGGQGPFASMTEQELKTVEGQQYYVSRMVEVWKDMVFAVHWLIILALSMQQSVLVIKRTFRAVLGNKHQTEAGNTLVMVAAVLRTGLINWHRSGRWPVHYADTVRKEVMRSIALTDTLANLCCTAYPKPSVRFTRKFVKDVLAQQVFASLADQQLTDALKVWARDLLEQVSVEQGWTVDPSAGPAPTPARVEVVKAAIQQHFDSMPTNTTITALMAKHFKQERDEARSDYALREAKLRRLNYEVRNLRQRVAELEEEVDAANFQLNLYAQAEEQQADGQQGDELDDDGGDGIVDEEEEKRKDPTVKPAKVKRQKQPKKDQQMPARPPAPARRPQIRVDATSSAPPSAPSGNTKSRKDSPAPRVAANKAAATRKRGHGDSDEDQVEDKRAKSGNSAGGRRMALESAEETGQEQQ